MRIGYAIQNKRDRSWLQTRLLADVSGAPCPVSVWVQDNEEAMIFRKLPDAKQMLKALRKESRRPEYIHIINPYGKVIV